VSLLADWHKLCCKRKAQILLTFKYQALETSGNKISGSIKADDRRSALRLLEERGLFPSLLETTSETADHKPAEKKTSPSASSDVTHSRRVSRKEITAFTRELATLINATIPIPTALQGLGSEEENPALKKVILDLAFLVQSGRSLSDAMATHPKLFPKLYSSMVKVGEEAGVLDKVLSDLSDLLEHEDEIRSEVLGAVAYPCFVLLLGVVTTAILLIFVLPRLFEMLKGMLDVLPLPTKILLTVSDFFEQNWLWVLIGAVVTSICINCFLRTSTGAFFWDSIKLRIPIIGGVFRASALGRFARTLGTLVENGVSLLPALEISRNTVGNRFYAESIKNVAEDTRGGESLAGPLRKLDLFPATMVQMIAVGEETGNLDTMLLRVANMQERIMRSRSRTLISLLAPVLILFVGTFVGFIVISLLLPIFKMSQLAR